MKSTASLDAGTLTMILGTIALLGFGQVLFKSAATGLELSNPRSLLSFQLVAALAVYGFATLAWLVVLSRVPLVIAFPFYGLGFLLVPLMAWALLNEPLRWQTLVGGAIILVGIVVSSLGARK